jgi:Clostridium epsilon toxin ETX/Bacillus mosquitocidal toxin MTX2
MTQEAVASKSTSKPSSDTPDNFDLHSYFSGFTIGRITEHRDLKAEQAQDFGEIYKVPARGNLGGGVHFELRRAGRKVKELALWSQPDRLRGVQVTFDDGAIMKAGVLDGQSRAISFHPDESITSTTISSSAYKAGRAGNLQLKTDFGQDYLGVFPSIPIFNRFTPFTDVKRGTLIGVYGGAGADIDNMGIILALPEDTEYQYFNVRYDLSAFKAVGERLLSLKEGIVENGSSSSIDQAMSFSHTYSATKTWSNSVGLKAGVKTTVKTGVPFLVEGKVELSFEASYTYNWGETVTDQKSDAWTVTVKVSPHSRVRVLATVLESTIDVPYTADLTVVRSDGSSKKIANFSGVYRGINVSRFTVKAEDIPKPK